MRVLFLVLCLCQVLCFASKNVVAAESFPIGYWEEKKRIGSMSPATLAVHDAEQDALCRRLRENFERIDIERKRREVAAYDAKCLETTKKPPSDGRSSDSDYQGHTDEGRSASEQSPALGARGVLDVSPPPQIYLPNSVYPSSAANVRVLALQPYVDTVKDGDLGDDESDADRPSHRNKRLQWFLPRRMTA